MSALKATLFGNFNIMHADVDLKGMEARKVQELLSYLLINRNHTQPRELLCEILWGDQSSTNARKYLRQTLWRVQSVLRAQPISGVLDLMINNNWIQINISSDFWLDIAEFENVYDLVKGKNVHELGAQHQKLLEYAVGIYKGDLLEGWYPDWCIFERERYQTMHLLLLDKLVQYCELHEYYEAGLSYGMEILRNDHAYERTHRQLMRFYYLIGNRTEALHQYERCVMALHTELGVEPSEKTKLLYDQIRADDLRRSFISKEMPSAAKEVYSTSALNDVIHRLEEVSKVLRKLEDEIVGLGKTVTD
jgi:DNA-binding SARP family transcriptional activator